jgi:bis(5'-nucleosyl)-tetraphosphatase (symmetrical)
MATYAIGDIQGCFEPLQRLLDEVGFDAGSDRLWLTGDLVNRGPDSLATLRFVRSLGESAVLTLGNHDLHLLAVAEGCEKLKREDRLQDVLDAPDRDALLDWLRHCPLMHFEGGWAMVHAGLLPAWSVSRALELAAEVEAALRAPTYRSFLARMYGNHPERWNEALTGIRLRVTVNAGGCAATAEGMEFTHKGHHSRRGLSPWFNVPGAAAATRR